SRDAAAARALSHVTHLVYPFVFSCSGDHRHLPSFPTRRSSDLLTITAWMSQISPLRMAKNSATSLSAAWAARCGVKPARRPKRADRKSTRLNSSHVKISYAVFCLKKKKLVTEEPAYQHRKVS